MALIVPLVTPRMFTSMTFKWALTLWALLSLVMAPIPWVGKFLHSIAQSRGFQRFYPGPFLLRSNDPLS